MSSLGNLDSAQSREVEEQLFSTHRLQATRHMPVPLPRQDFWSMVKKLLNTLDMEIQSMLMKGITGMRLQNLQKRQANIRHIASELARKRTVAMVQHVSSQSLRSATQHGAFFHAVQIAMDRFKMEVDWSSMQDGLAGEGLALPKRHAPGTMQLDSFTDQAITSRPPPPLAFEDNGPDPLPEADHDEEHLMAPDEWPDLDEYIHADLEETVHKSKPVASNDNDDEMAAFMSQSDGTKHAAAMDFGEGSEQPATEEIEVKVSEVEAPEAGTSLIRIRVLMSSPEPIVIASGESLALEAGDVHFVDQDSAEWLIESGVAEAASL